MKILVIMSPEGRPGKTTIATNLYVAAQQHGKSVVLFDLDPQASACFWADRRKATGRGNTPLVQDVDHTKLSDYIEAMQNQKADLVILDCPTGQSEIVAAVLTCADLILIPLRPDATDLRTMAQTANLSQTMGKKPTVVLTLCPSASAEIGQARELITEKLKLDVAPVEIRLRKSYQRALQDGLAVHEYKASGQAAEEIAQLYAYVTLALFGTECDRKKTALSPSVKRHHAEESARSKPKAKRQYALVDNPETTLVGANLPARYARNVAILHAETGKSKKEILQEALDLYFAVKGKFR